MRLMPTMTALLVIAALHAANAPAFHQSSNPTETAEQRLKKLREQKRSRKHNREKAIQKLRARLAPLMKYSIEDLQLAITIQVGRKYSGASVIAADPNMTFLGTIGGEFEANSVFNTFGRHGSKFSPNSIWNEFGLFGGKFSINSPFNEFSVSPPFIVKAGKIIGRLTVNKSMRGAVDPNWLRSHFTY